MSDPYVGEIRMFAGNFAPYGWLFCQGQTLPIAEYDTLFALIGTTYGGDGVEVFNLPDMQSRYPVHTGQGGVAGQFGGAETVTLATAEMPPHTHPVLAANAGATSASPSGAFWASWRSPQYRTSAPTAAMNPGALSPAGGSQPHDNMPPFLAVNFIISVFGIYPSQA